MKCGLCRRGHLALLLAPYLGPPPIRGAWPPFGTPITSLSAPPNEVQRIGLLFGPSLWCLVDSLFGPLLSGPGPFGLSCLASVLRRVSKVDSNICTIDIQDNRLDDPDIVPEV